MKIISRSEWGAQPWRSGTTARPLSALSRVLIHYHGGPPRATSGVAVPKEIEAIHLANGWSGVGYHFVVSQAGEIFEGRGWDKVGAHCPGHNTDGLGIYIGVGGDQEPTEAAKRAARWLYDEACRRTGKTLTKSWHGYDYATECPGPKLIAWVKAGMPVASSTTAPTKAPATKAPAAQTYTREDVARLQRVLGLDDDGLWGPATEKQAQAIRRCLKPGMKRSAWDRARYWRLRMSRPQGKQTSDSLRRAHQWALGVTVDGDWGPATDAAWRAMREQHKR